MPTKGEEKNPAPLTGARTAYDAIRHVAVHGPGRSEAEAAELTAAVNASDPDYRAPEADDDKED